MKEIIGDLVLRLLQLKTLANYRTQLMNSVVIRSLLGFSIQTAYNSQVIV